LSGRSKGVRVRRNFHFVWNERLSDSTPTPTHLAPALLIGAIMVLIVIAWLSFR